MSVTLPDGAVTWPLPEGYKPWVRSTEGEPDLMEWVDPATGARCLFVRRVMGTVCGYVAVPDGHPWHGVDHDSHLADLSWSGVLARDEFNDGTWWVGDYMQRAYWSSSPAFGVADVVDMCTRLAARLHAAR